MADIEYGNVPAGPTVVPLATATYIFALEDTGAGPTPLAARMVDAAELATPADLTAGLAGKAPLANPTFTGTVTLPAGQVVNGVTLTTGGGTTDFLRADGAYAAPPGGGGGSPGGSDTHVQFNNAGAFGGSADFTWNDANKTLSLGANAEIDMAANATNPAAPVAGTGRIFMQSVVGRSFPAWIENKFAAAPLQSAFYDGKRRFTWASGNTGIGTPWGDLTTTSGTFSVGGPNFASPFLSWNLRATYANVVTTANQNVGVRSNNLLFFRNNVAGQAGGFFFYGKFGYDVWTNGGRHFYGLGNTFSPVTANPSATAVAQAAFIVDASDNGAISFHTHNGTTGTKAATGLTIVSGKGYECWIFAPFNSTDIYWQIKDVNTGTIASGTATATLPPDQARMAVLAYGGNAALTPVTSVRLSLTDTYVETAQ